ncbi:MAG: carboxylating nicotinate-nucleotide diphosphorylase [Flavobacteriales bacterium]|nr:carboxylating nicotinate-nucleotide diphosphorylase [Flavobacteriales bacterium]
MNLSDFIENALKEDIGNGDHTSMACVSASEIGEAKILIKEPGIIAGLKVAEAVLKTVDENLIISHIVNDGETVANGDIVLTVKGSSLSILKAERLVLNCLQRMSGVATLTSEYVKLLEPYETKILDTRKTTPGFRLLEKEAVKIGGGNNHRFGLYDMVMIKNNHVDYCGGISQAIIKTKAYLSTNNLNIPIEVESRNLTEVQEILNEGGVNRIMLDNFNYEQTSKAVTLIDGRYETESSGNITKSTIVEYAKCGVDFISVGALTHSYTSLDISLRAIND